MWIWSFALEFFEGDKRLTAVALSVMFLTVQLAAVGICVKSTGLYAALCLLVVSGGSIYLMICGVDGEAFLLMFAIVCAWMGIGYAIVYACLEIKGRIAYRRQRRAEIKRRLQFTLPDRENGYLRDRLHTALNMNKEELCNEKRGMIARMGYARKMIARIKEAPLTPVERIDVEELAGVLALYDRKERWSASDVKTISEIFSRLIKLAAKYEIAV